MTPRQLAHTLLQRVETNDQFLNLALDHALQSSNLSDQDRGLCSALVYGVTERRITLDYQISHLSSRPCEELDLSVRTALRLGLYQLIYMDRIPPHAAINECVSLVTRKASGFVNAILRSFTRDPSLRLPKREEDPLLYLSVSYSVGLPLVRKLCDAYGEERTESILRAFADAEPITTLSVNTLRVSREELSSHISHATPTEYATTGLSARGAVRALPGFEEGHFFVQDEASQLCVEVLDAKPGELLMDICACPGSKSFGSAIRMQNHGQVLSFDLHEKKLPLIESGARRLGITIITPSARDGRNPLPEYFGKADRVLCDVPCSGFGVIGKKPELRYKDPSASEALPDIQLAILENACQYVKHGGTLVYSTCTIFPEENERNVLRFLEKHSEFSLSPLETANLSVERGYETFLPDRYPMDGFFIARMTRK